MLGCIITCSNSKAASSASASASASASDYGDREHSTCGSVNPPKEDHNSSNCRRKSSNAGINSVTRDHHITTPRSIISNQLVKKGRLNINFKIPSCVSSIYMPTSSTQRLAMEQQLLMDEEEERLRLCSNSYNNTTMEASSSSSSASSSSDDDEEEDNGTKINHHNTSINGPSSSSPAPAPSSSSFHQIGSTQWSHNHSTTKYTDSNGSISSISSSNYVNHHRYANCKQRNVSILDHSSTPVSGIRSSPSSSSHHCEESIISRNNGEGAIRNGEDQAEEEECEEEKSVEWIAQVEPGILITFQSFQDEHGDGGNELKRIRFSREMFDKLDAQQWWANNCEKIHELYNVRKRNTKLLQSLPLPQHREDKDYIKPNTNIKPQHQQISGSYDNIDETMFRALPGHDHMGTQKNSLVCSPAKYDIAHTGRSNYHIDQQDVRPLEIDQHSFTTQSDNVYEDELGVYITTTLSPQGLRELKRIRFSREMFNEKQARVWWEQNRVRIYQQYL